MKPRGIETYVAILCTSMVDYNHARKLLADGGYRDVAGTPDNHVAGILDRDGIMILAAFKDMTAWVGALYPLKFEHRVNGCLYRVHMVVNARNLGASDIAFWKRKRKGVK